MAKTILNLQKTLENGKNYFEFLKNVKIKNFNFQISIVR